MNLTTHDLFGMRHRLFLALGLVGGAALGSGCLDTAPIDECFDVAMEDDRDDIDVFQLFVGEDGDCPNERAHSVKAAAQEHADDCAADGKGSKLRYVACGPLAEQAEADGICEYVAVYHDDVECWVAGRPFLVDQSPRLAEACERGDWSLASALERPDDERLARRLAAHWTEIALAEHASIAAFARFALQLMTLGAPPELLRDCQAAMLDETRHAQLAFGLASRFTAAPVGPGALELTGAFADSSIESILRDVVLEGCLGETRAAAEARAAAGECEQPELRAVLEAIADDEELHAALAWRFVAWLLDQRPELAPSFARALGSALELGPIPEQSDAIADPSWGLLDHAVRRRIDVQTRAQIVAPLGRALLARTPADARASRGSSAQAIG
ncbi:hypothetical protein ACNOYE_32020 [Nannocystaceae bacterium ST9]